MRKILQNFNNVGNKKVITECGDMPQQGISLQAGSASEMAALLKALANVDSAPAMDMQRLAGPIDDPSIPGRDDVPDDQDVDSSYDNPNFSDTVKAMGGSKIAPLPTSQRKEPTIAKPTLQLTPDMRVGEGDPFGDATTEPDEEYMDISAVLTTGDDMHKTKKSFKPTNGGDNPMALESIKDRLWAALNEKKTESAVSKNIK